MVIFSLIIEVENPGVFIFARMFAFELNASYLKTPFLPVTKINQKVKWVN